MPPKITEHEVDGFEFLAWHDKETKEICVSAKSGGWLPGTFADIDAAVLGVKACLVDECGFVDEIQKPVNHFDKGNRAIVVSDFDSFWSRYEE